MPKVNQTLTNNKRKAPANRSMPASKIPKNGDKKKATNAAFWEIKSRSADGSEDKSPYEHLWDFLTKRKGLYLAAYKGWPHYGSKYSIFKLDIAKGAKDYLADKGIEKKLSSVRMALHKLDKKCEMAYAQYQVAGDDTDLANREYLTKICPVWDEAKEYYSQRTSPLRPSENEDSNSARESITAFLRQKRLKVGLLDDKTLKLFGSALKRHFELEKKKALVNLAVDYLDRLEETGSDQKREKVKYFIQKLQRYSM